MLTREAYLSLRNFAQIVQSRVAPSGGRTCYGAMVTSFAFIVLQNETLSVCRTTVQNNFTLRVLTFCYIWPKKFESMGDRNAGARGKSASHTRDPQI